MTIEILKTPEQQTQDLLNLLLEAEAAARDSDYHTQKAWMEVARLRSRLKAHLESEGLKDQLPRTWMYANGGVW